MALHLNYFTNYLNNSIQCFSKYHGAMYRHLNTLSFMVYLHFNIASFRGIIPIFRLTGQSCPTLLYSLLTSKTHSSLSKLRFIFTPKFHFRLLIRTTFRIDILCFFVDFSAFYCECLCVKFLLAVYFL